MSVADQRTLKFVTHQPASPQVVGNLPRYTPHVPTDREKQSALLKRRLGVTDAELEALPENLRQRLAAAVGLVSKFGPPQTVFHAASAMVTDGHPGFAPRPHVLVSKAERERLEQPETVGLPRPAALVTAQERAAAALPPSIGLPRPQVIVNKRDRR
jgi:hypothetical protein